MQRLRELLESHAWVGWALAVLLLVASVVLYLRRDSGGGLYSPERMTETLTIKCIETGKEWTIKRGIMEVQLRARGTMLDPLQGLPNPETGKLTGFPKNSVWEETVARLNREKEALMARKGLSPEAAAQAVETVKAAEGADAPEQPD